MVKTLLLDSPFMHIYSDIKGSEVTHRGPDVVTEFGLNYIASVQYLQTDGTLQ